VCTLSVKHLVFDFLERYVYVCAVRVCDCELSRLKVATFKHANVGAMCYILLHHTVPVVLARAVDRWCESFGANGWVPWAARCRPKAWTAESSSRSFRAIWPWRWPGPSSCHSDGCSRTGCRRNSRIQAAIGSRQPPVDRFNRAPTMPTLSN
jgi:hypothetical protein